MKFDNDSAFGPVDIVVSNAGLQHVAPPPPRHKDGPAAGRAAAMLAFAAGFLVAALGARAADEPARPRPAAERAGTDSARAQPTAEQFAPPNQPDISATTRAPSTRYIASSSVRLRQPRRVPARRPAFGQRQAMTPPGALGAGRALDKG